MIVGKIEHTRKQIKHVLDCFNKVMMNDIVFVFKQTLSPHESTLYLADELNQYNVAPLSIHKSTVEF